MGRFAGGIVEKQDDVVMQRSLITLEGQGIFAALIHNLAGDGAARQLSASAVTIAPFRVSISSSFGTAGISFDFVSVAICANTNRCSQPSALDRIACFPSGAIRSRKDLAHALTMCNGDLPLALSNERRRTLPPIATTPSHCLHIACTLLGKARHEPLKRCPEPLRIEPAEKPAAFRQAQECHGWARHSRA